MKIRLKSGITYQNRSKILPHIKKSPKKLRLLEGPDSINSIYQQIHEHFLKYDLLQLNEFGEDKENYGSLIIKGISYPPKKININLIKKKIKEEEKEQNNIYFNNNRSTENSKFDSFISSKRKKRKFLSPNTRSMLPLLYKKRNQNNSLEELNTDKSNNIINVKYYKQKEVFERNYNNDLFISDNNKYKSYDDKQYKKYNLSPIKQTGIRLDKTKILPVLHNKIKINDRIYKLFLQTKKIEGQSYKSKKNNLLKRINFLKRYDSTNELNTKLNELSNKIKKMNGCIYKSIDRNDEDKPQFNLRFNYLLSQFKE